MVHLGAIHGSLNTITYFCMFLVCQLFYNQFDHHVVSLFDRVL